MALTAEQLAARRVGGSDVATILGLNPYKTVVELYHEKRGTLDTIDLTENLNVEAGNVLEDGIAELAGYNLSRLWGKPVKLRRSNITIVNPLYDWLTIHIDRDVVGEDRGVELKNVGARAAREWGDTHSDDIPTHYLAQVHTYLLVKGYPVWTVAAYFGGADLRLYEVHRDPDWDTVIIERTRDFWHYNVLQGIPPELPEECAEKYPVAHERLLKRLYAGTDGTTLSAQDADIARYLATLARETRIAAESEAMATIARNKLLRYMKNAAVLEVPSLPGFKLTRKKVERKGYEVGPTSYIEARVSQPKDD